MSSSKARASVSLLADAAVDDGDGSREQADMRGNVVLHASATMASRRVNWESDNGRSD
jgi:hypothetical protein